MFPLHMILIIRHCKKEAIAENDEVEKSFQAFASVKNSLT